MTSQVVQIARPLTGRICPVRAQRVKTKTQDPFVALVYAASSFLRVTEALNAGKKTYLRKLWFFVNRTLNNPAQAVKLRFQYSLEWLIRADVRA